MVGLLMLGILAGCGSGMSDGDDEATEVPTTAPSNVEPTGEPSAAAVVVTNPPDEEPYPTSTLYAESEPTPTVLAGSQCSYGNDARIELQDFEQMRAELHVCNEEFAWPVGYEIDPERLAFQEGGSNVGSGEVGLARLMVTFVNACAWMTAWVDYTQAGDSQAADQALQYMQLTLPYWRTEGPPDPASADPMFQDPIDKARLGDPSYFQAWLNGPDCAIYELSRVQL